MTKRKHPNRSEVFDIKFATTLELKSYMNFFMYLGTGFC